MCQSSILYSIKNVEVFPAKKYIGYYYESINKRYWEVNAIGLYYHNIALYFDISFSSFIAASKENKLLE